MVEVDIGLSKLASQLLIPEVKPLVTNEDIVELFGPNYRKLVEDKARELGIREELRFFDRPMPHDGSQAVYLVEQFVEDDLILVPILGSYMKTSKHHHEAPMFREVYFHIAGESFVNVGEEKLALNQRQSLIRVPLGVSHQVRTQEAPALTLIVMENARLVPSGRLHIKNAE